jgi:hypothetical protein
VTDPYACECDRLTTFFGEAELDTYTYITTTIVKRLDPNRGAVMKANATARIAQLRQTLPEQVPYMTALTRGSDYSKRYMLNLDDLVRFYFNGPGTIGAGGRANVADEDLTYTTVRTPAPIKN